MFPPRDQMFTLTPHPTAPCDPVQDITGHVYRMPDGTLSVSYILRGDLDRVRVPARQHPRFSDDLWRHTCCELFIARKGRPAYYEFNFSPAGEWALYAFERMRQRVALSASIDVEELNPHIAVRRTAEKLELNATIRLNALSPLYTDAKLTLGLSAVVEDEKGVLSYWALKHPLDQPDFHHPDAFILELDEIRN